MAYTQDQLQALRNALAKCERRVTFGDKMVEYRTVEELKEAISHIEDELRKEAVAAGTAPRAPRQIRINTGKGF